MRRLRKDNCKKLTKRKNEEVGSEKEYSDEREYEIKY
jgi:hypothetical protein